jgi:hypothetical protein
MLKCHFEPYQKEESINADLRQMCHEGRGYLDIAQDHIKWRILY